MPSKGHDKSKGAAGSTKKPIKEQRFTSGKKREGQLERDAETPDISPSPGGWPQGQPMEQKY